MNKKSIWKKNVTGKIALLLSGILLLTSVAGIGFMLIGAEIGIYQNKFEDVWTACSERLQSYYAFEIFRYAEEDPDYLEDSNLEYGIIRVDGEETFPDLKNAEYVYENFEKSPSEKSYIELFADTSYTVVSLESKLIQSLFESHHTHLGIDDDWRDYRADVKKVIYNQEDGLFYYQTEEYYFLIDYFQVEKENFDLSYLKERKGIYTENEYEMRKLIWQDSEFFYHKKEKEYQNWENWPADMSSYQNWKSIIFEDITLDVEEIEVHTGDIPKAKKVQEGEYDTYLKDDKLCLWYEFEEESEGDFHGYGVVTQLKEDLSENTKDVFWQQKQILTTMYTWRYPAVVITIVSMTGWLICMVIICRMAAERGHLSCAGDKIYLRAEEGELPHKISIFYRIPFEICVFVTGCIIVTAIWFVAEGLEVESMGLDAVASLPKICYVGAVLYAYLVYLIAVSLIENFSYRFGGEILFRYTLCYQMVRLCRWFWKKVKTFVKKCITGLYIVQGNIPLFFRVFLTEGLITVLQFIVIMVTEYDIEVEVFAFFIFKLIEVPVLLIALIQIDRLQKGSKALAEGDLQSRVDTRKMFWEMKRHGEYLNQINDGIQVAVEERMKSERFRTELITNVSHDIKTPLTSIINYVDLLQKENLQEPKVVEYLEVLERQSARLKKLIDDLMEASKASTGNLEVHLESCDVGILLTQIVGEFEEKMSEAGLDMIITSQEEEVIIQADNRHLWRVFDNLMTNIYKYSQSGTRVYITQESKDGEVVFIFRNTSKYPLNISGEELLERFVRGDASRHTEGNGLGLAIAQNLTELMGGKLILAIDGDLFKLTLIFKN